VASTAIHGLLNSAGIEAGVLRISEQGIWLETENQVLVVAIGEEARLPSGIHLPKETSPEVFDRVTEQSSATIGNGRVMLEGLSVTVSRWWDPRPVLPPFDPAELVERLAGLPSELADIDTTSLRDSLAAHSAGGILHSARSLLGKGLGVTPEGDDLLVGALAATRLLAEASRRERVVALVAGVSVPLARLAAARTNPLSAALIRMALRGQIVEPAGDFVRALAGRGDVAASHLSLIRLGHTSGPALASGIVLGATGFISREVRG
jgi:hypothetical protein